MSKQAQKCWDDLFRCVCPGEGRPSGIRMNVIAVGLLNLAYAIDADTPEQQKAVNDVKRSVNQIKKELKIARGFGTLQANAIRPQYKTLIQQGRQLCALTSRGDLDSYEAILGT